MPIREEITPNAAMLFPRTQTVELAGKAFKLLELDVNTIALLEHEVAGIVESPFDHKYREAVAFMESTAEQRENHRQERINAFYLIMEARQSWPPTFQTSNFNRCLATDLGQTVFLAVMLRRSNGFISDSEVVDIATQMTGEEWDTLNRIAWGFPEWMAFGASESQSPGRGLNWAKTVEELATKRGWTYAQIGEMYVNQIINAANQGEPWTVWINDPPEPVSDHASIA